MLKHDIKHLRYRNFFMIPMNIMLYLFTFWIYCAKPVLILKWDTYTYLITFYGISVFIAVGCSAVICTKLSAYQPPRSIWNSRVEGRKWRKIQILFSKAFIFIFLIIKFSTLLYLSLVVSSYGCTTWDMPIFVHVWNLP